MIPPLTPALLADDDDEVRHDEVRRRFAAAALRTAARGRLADPADAPKFIDPADLDVGAHGETSDAQATAAIDNLLISKPYLAPPPPLGSVHFVSPTTEHRQEPTHHHPRPLYEGHTDRGTTPPQNRFSYR